MTTFIGQSYAENDDGEFYHGFKKNGVVFSALHYCMFTEEKSNQKYFGKIHSVFLDKDSGKKMVEITVFQYTPLDQKRTDSDTYNELWMVLENNIEIPISSIEAQEISILHIPATVTDSHLLSYVEKNIGKPEHQEYEDSDDESTDSMDDFIVNGDIYGFYQYAVDNANDKIEYAPPPQFYDKFLSFETTDIEERIKHEFVKHLQDQYIQPKMNCFEEQFILTDQEIIHTLMNQQYLIKNEKFYVEGESGQVHLQCDLEPTKRLTAFVFLLKTMLTKEEVPNVIDMYNFCLKFKYSY